MDESVKGKIIKKFSEDFYKSLLERHNDEDFWVKLYHLYKKRDLEESFFNEVEIISIILKKFKDEYKTDEYKAVEYKTDYSILEPTGLGGSGLIIKILNEKLKVHRALKFPRPKKSKEENIFLIESLREERKILSSIIHENIVSIYDLGELVDITHELKQFPYYIMEYIKDAIDLKKYFDKRISKGQLKDITRDCAQIFLEISKGLALLHKNQLIHFDIKPENILIQNGKPRLSDLGFAKRKSEDQKKIVIGFTLYYAHPELKEGLRQGESLSRITTMKSPAEYKFKYDIFALGKTFLEILSVISEKLSLMEFDYNFAYLHLLACRMLDGQNLNEIDYNEKKKIGLPVYKEHWGDLDKNDFIFLKYKQKIGKRIIKQITTDLKKLIYKDLYIKELPELSDNYPNRIRISLYCDAPFSSRIKHIVEHPVFSRLGEQHQLTLINTIYPTATHSTLEHSIGAFNNCCLYVRSLYNDPYNPLFKQLIDVHEIKILLLASIFHDLGQYPFAQYFKDFEEFKSQLNPNNITLDFLRNLSKDKNGYCLRQYIKNEWGVRIKEIIALLSRVEILNVKKKRDLKLDLLSSIIDGIIDINKLDHYQRDTHNCNLSYGLMIDSSKMIRNLTVIIDKDSKDNNTFAIGVYRRAQAAAETLAFTRYLLYQSVYWHHTARSFISMLKFVLRSLIDFSKDFNNKFKEFLGIYCHPNRINALKVLEFIKKYILEVDHKDKENLLNLVEMIKKRNYYKRIYTIHYSREDLKIKGQERLLSKYRRKQANPNFQQNLREEIISFFIKEYPKYEKAEIISREKIKKTLDILNQDSSLICDSCDPEYELKNLMLEIIPEPKYSYNIQKNIKMHRSEVIEQVYGILINIVSKGRIYCHPEIRDTLMQVLTLMDIESCVNKAMDSTT